MKPDPASTPAADAAAESAGPQPLLGLMRRWVKPLVIAFAVLVLLHAVLILFRIVPGASEPWLAGLLWVLAALSTLASLAHRLPLQNVVGCAVVVLGLFLVVGTIGSASGVPFGAVHYTRNLGPALPGGLPWLVPVIGLVFLVNSRGVARLIMRPWRKTHRYGLWVIGLTGVLCVLLDLGLEVFATRLRHYWFWRAGGGQGAFLAAPWTNSLAWLVLTVFTTAVATPWLINKHPVKQPPDYHPVFLWSLLHLMFLVGAAVAGSWLTVGIGLVGGTTAVVYAIRGARW